MGRTLVVHARCGTENDERGAASLCEWRQADHRFSASVKTEVMTGQIGGCRRGSQLACEGEGRGGGVQLHYRTVLTDRWYRLCSSPRLYVLVRLRLAFVFPLTATVPSTCASEQSPPQE